MPGSGASGLQRFMVVTRNVLRTVTYSHATPKGEPFAYLKVQGSSPNILLPTSTSPQLLTKSQRSTQAQYVQSQSSNYQIHTKSAIMGKSHKFNDRDHAGLADGTAAPTEHLPRYFAKSGHVDADPKKAKKNGAGKGGWGVDGEEVQDEGFNLANARRRSNSSSYTAGLKDFKTKFETIETEPVFEEDIHGVGEEDSEDLPETRRINTESSEGSIDEDDKAKSV